MSHQMIVCEGHCLENGCGDPDTQRWRQQIEFSFHPLRCILTLVYVSTASFLFFFFSEKLRKISNSNSEGIFQWTLNIHHEHPVMFTVLYLLIHPFLPTPQCMLFF